MVKNLNSKISVITVCYNSADTIEKTIQSVIYQTAFPNIEYIIIDGSSKDNTLEVIKKYQDKISLLISEPDSGIYNAMNKGIKNATGNYIHFLNSNDFFASDDVIEKVIETINCTNSDFIVGDVILVTADNQKVLRSNQQINALSLFTDWLYHVTLFSKKSLFEKYGSFDESYKIAADNNWIFPLMLNKNITKSYVNKAIAEFKLDGVSSQQQTRETTIDELEKILAKNFKGKNNFLRKIIQDKIFNKKAPFCFRILNKIIRKIGLHKTLRRLIASKQDWQIQYSNS